MSLISFKPLGIGKSPDFHAKLVVQDYPNCPKILKYGIKEKRNGSKIGLP
jgi:hypothetical protein